MGDVRFFELGSVRIPVLALVPASRQVFESDVAEHIHRMGNGNLKKQSLAGSVGKLRGTLSGEGPLPPGLDGLDYTGELLLKSAAQRDIVSTSNIIDIPAARRSDSGYEPFGRAYVDTPRFDTPVLTPVTMSADEATLTSVPGATRYQVVWYPEFMVLVEGGIHKNEDLTGATISWRIGVRQA